MPNFYTIYIRPAKSITHKDIEAKMDKCIDWFRIDENNFIVYSSSPTDKLTARFSPLIKVEENGDSEGYLMIMRVNPLDSLFGGWMPQELWDWLEKER